MHVVRTGHLEVVHRIFWYIKGSPGHRTKFRLLCSVVADSLMAAMLN